MKKTKSSTAAVSATQAIRPSASAPPGMSIARMSRAMSMSVVRLAIGLAACAFEHVGGDCRGGGGHRLQRSTFAPSANHDHNERKAQSEGDAGNGPGQAVETVRGRFGQDLFSIFLHERLHDQVVSLAGAHALVDFLNHRDGERAI